MPRGYTACNACEGGEVCAACDVCAWHAEGPTCPVCSLYVGWNVTEDANDPRALCVDCADHSGVYSGDDNDPRHLRPGDTWEGEYDPECVRCRVVIEGLRLIEKDD